MYDTENSFWNSIAKLLIIFLVFVSLSFADTALEDTLCDVYEIINGLIPIIAFVLFVLAGVAYAAGQFFGAEMRAKAQSWSMSMITGAIIGLLIVQFANILIESLTGVPVKDICG